MGWQWWWWPPHRIGFQEGIDRREISDIKAMEVIIQGEGGSTVEGREMIELNKKQVCFYGEKDDDETACSCM